MSTRSNIIVVDEWNAIQLYRHSDGYPDGVIPDLKRALPIAWELPRMEADDFSAAIVAAWKDNGGGNIYIDGSADPNNLVNPTLLHGDIEYLYIIKPDKEAGKWAVECHEIHIPYNDKEKLEDKIIFTGHIGDDFKL